jgi:hypothetical protein
MQTACQNVKNIGRRFRFLSLMLLIQNVEKFNTPSPSRFSPISSGMKTPAAVQVCKPRIVRFSKNHLF